MKERKLTTVIRDLLFALLNATLILAAICLWLAWQVSDTISSAASDFAKSLISLEPLREDVRHMTEEIAALRTDLVSIREKTGVVSSDALLQIQDRLDSMQQTVSGTFGKMETIASQPYLVVDYAIDRTAVAVKAGVGEFLECKCGEFTSTRLSDDVSETGDPT